MQPAFHRRGHQSEQGYVLLTLMLFVALLTVAALAIAPTITFQIKRDREEELIHRGVQYSRAIRNYYKKFGRYPTNLKDLDNTNNQRFLRKHYKDPITGKDFKLLHFSEVQMMGLGAGITGATPVSAMNGGAGQGSAGQGTGGQEASGGFTLGTSPTTGTQSNLRGQVGPEGAGTNSSSSSGQGALGGGQIIGGPIVGVISASKEKSIREFGGKNHYNQWQFVYDPMMDRGTALLSTPAQPLTFGMGTNANLPSQQGRQGAGPGSTGFGTNNPSPASPNPQSPGSSPVSPPVMPPDP